MPRSAITLSSAYHDYARLLRQLHELAGEGRGDGEQADDLRDAAARAGRRRAITQRAGAVDGAAGHGVAGFLGNREPRLLEDADVVAAVGPDRVGRGQVLAHHPLVRTEPKTGRKALFLGRRPNSYVLGLDVAGSEALLDALWAHATQLKFAVCHEWKVGDVLMWNNLSVLHRRDPFDPKSRRIMHRSQIKGHERIA